MTQGGVTEEFETPVTARDRCRKFGNELVAAELELKRARQTETDAEIAHGRAKAAYELGKYQAFLSPEAPTVARGESTVAEKEAWCEIRCKALREEMLNAWAVWKAGQTLRESAKEHYDRCETTANLAQSILRSIDRAFWSPGREES